MPLTILGSGRSGLAKKFGCLVLVNWTYWGRLQSASSWLYPLSFLGWDIQQHQYQGCVTSYDLGYVYWLVVWNMLFFLHILGIIIPPDFHIFQRGRSTTNQINSILIVFRGVETTNQYRVRIYQGLNENSHVMCCQPSRDRKARPASSWMTSQIQQRRCAKPPTNWRRNRFRGPGRRGRMLKGLA